MNNVLQRTAHTSAVDPYAPAKCKQRAKYASTVVNGPFFKSKGAKELTASMMLLYIKTVTTVATLV